MSGQFWWYVVRASGMVAWLMLTASVLCGLALSSRTLAPRRHTWLLDLHRWLGGLVLGFVALHVIGLLADSYVDIGPLDVLVPFASSYQTLAVALGVVAGWLLVTVQLTSLVMDRLPRRVWHGIHLSTYGVFALGTLHGFTGGTDAGSRIVLVTGLLGSLAVVVTTAWRVTRGAARKSTSNSTVPVTPTW